MGRRAKQGQQQEEFWVAHSELPRTVAHPFYQRLNQVLKERGFDEFVEQQCERFYAAAMGRPALTPGRYFRLLLIGYFEGIEGERGIAWRGADSLALRHFLELKLSEAPPDHSTISRTRRLIAVETHQAVFRWVLEFLAEKGLLQGKTVGIDATTLEANAAMRSIVRRDTGEGYEEFLRRLAEESGVATPTREQLAKLDRKRAKKGSNDDWVNPHDPEAEITQLKDGRTHLAYKAEHAVDLETGAVVAVTVAGGAAGDTETILETLPQAGEHIAEVACATNHQEAGGTSPSRRSCGSRDGQGVSQQRHVDGAPTSPGAELRFRTRSWAASLERQAGSAAGGVWQPPAHSGRARETVVTPSRRVSGTELRPRLRNGRHAACVLARTRECL